MKKKGARILVMDGEPEMVRLLQRTFTAHDFQVFIMTLAENPKEALNLYRPDLLLLGLDGLTATRVASLTGQVIAYLFILLGIWVFFTGSIVDDLWFGFIGWFLLSAAQSANAQGMLTSVLRGVTVGEVMHPTPATVPATISLQQLVDAYVLPGGLRYALVMQADQLVGLMTFSEIRHIPREQWEQVPVSTAMIRFPACTL